MPKKLGRTRAVKVKRKNVHMEKIVESFELYGKEYRLETGELMDLMRVHPSLHFAVKQKF